MSILLTADLHLTDRPEDGYRWRVFDHIIEAVAAGNVEQVLILGDAWDRKDHHSAVLVNQTVEAFARVAELVPLTVLRGNHDTTLRDPSFWQFLNNLDNIAYITRPTLLDSGRVLLLPHSPAPGKDWSALPMDACQAIFCHVTYPGALAENGQKLVGTSNLPEWSCRVYSGDVHTPQSFGNFIHVGAPHPVKFGDTYPCRMLVINADFDIVREIRLNPPKKLMIDITDPAQLDSIVTRPGDQVKIRFHCPASAIDGFGQNESSIAAWVARNGIIMQGGIEVTVAGSVQRDVDINQTPEAILQQFAAHEGLSQDVLATGLELLRSVA
jgi:hypothetical protein